MDEGIDVSLKDEQPHHNLPSSTFLTLDTKYDASVNIKMVHDTENFVKSHNVAPNVIIKQTLNCRACVFNCFRKHGLTIKHVFIYTLVILYLIYFGFALNYKFGDEGSYRLVLLTAAVCFGWCYVQFKARFGNKVYKACIKPCSLFLKRHKRILSRIVIIVIILLTITFIIVDVILKRPYHLISGVGILLILLVMFITSHDPAAIPWRTVLSGIVLQFIFALLVLRTSWGYSAFNWLSARITDYLSFTDEGARFVFGDQFREHFFAFRVMSTIVFFSSTISTLYYLGWMQVFIEKIVSIIMYCMGTGAMESLHASINIFVGWGEASMIVRPLLDQMTIAEIHAIMTNGFATVGGSTLGVYILYGAPANHLISASFLSAPAALIMTKLAYPDRLENRADKKTIPVIPSAGRGIMDAASSGAVAAMTIIGHILVNVIAFVSLLGFINAVLLWFGERIGLSPPDYTPLTFQLLCSYIFWPLVFMMGVPLSDCRIVARMVGVKVFVNEFIAYQDLGAVVKNGVVLNQFNGTWNWTTSENIILSNNITLVGGVISPRSEMIATYALCGFSDFVALGIMVAALTSLAPDRKYDIIKCGPRALVSGCMACFMTACMAAFVGGE